MNKNDYIRALDNITAPEALLERIEALELPAKKRTPVWKTITAVAACFIAVVIGFSGIMGGMLKAESEDRLNQDDMLMENADDSDYNSFADSEGNFTSDQSVTHTSSTATDRKIAKNATLSMKTKDYDTLMSNVMEKVVQYGGYIVQSQEYNYDNASNRNANMKIKIPADKLEKFIEEIGAIGTITSKTIESDDITDSYIDVESRIKALETEEETLLEIMKRAEKLTDVIELQERLSVVRSDLERMKAQKQSFDGMVAYSGVTLDISEVERVVEGSDTFLGEIKEKLMNNVYVLGDFFREATINIIAALPYIGIIGVVAAVGILVIKKVRKR